MTDITVGYHDDRLVAVKETDDPGRSARLGRKADPLSRLDHPGNVRLVDLTEGPPAILRTVFVGPDTWQRRAPVDEFRAPALAALIAAVADESRIVVTDIGSASPSVTEIVLHELGPVTVPPTTAPFESPATNPATPPPEFSLRRRPPASGWSSQAATSGRSPKPSSTNAARRQPEARFPPTEARARGER
ncbi:MAG: hypothetical protein CL433_06915 [Acidimicrobiaceae bacterium]|jgi:hypothetical protein|nr:hypothetical protein [Acidimicrobiaceae bacterium]HAB58268.1 hypothetical protein [Acidimicrobiaceae bacterium]